jgi:uncharacterized repeat protein (TIGR03803 family)
MAAAASLCLTLPAHAATQLTVIHPFTASNPDGSLPYAPLIQGSDGNFYGVASVGGPYVGGTVFKVTPAGALTVLHAFSYFSDDGHTPCGALVQGTNGNLYGTTESGGVGGSGTVFMISPQGGFTLLHSFSFHVDGEPEAGLTLASDGNYYGATSAGVFQMTPSGAVKLISSFDGAAYAGPPQSSLVQGRDGQLYGTTSPSIPDISGAYGAIFKVTTGGAATLLYTFTNGLDGEEPASGLVQGSDGNFYGTAMSSTNGCGTFYRISPSGTFTVLQQFSGTNGSGPGALIQAADGNLYGTTAGGGAYGGGTVYQASASGVLHTLYSVQKDPFFFVPPPGNNPPAGLVQSTNGILYGITLENGIAQGTGYSAEVFSITTNGDYSPVFLFPGGGGDGAGPMAGLLLASNGVFYGTTERGGTYDFGAVFQCDTNGNVLPLHSFTGESDGAFPVCTLVMDSQGGLYGTTTYGLISSSGTVFEIATNGDFSTLYTFTGGADGDYPQAGLTPGGDGSFYGTTEEGGDGFGTFFRITPNSFGLFTNICAFSASGDDGSGSATALVRANDGNFYGACDLSEDSVYDGIFRVTPQGNVSFVCELTEPASLMQAADGSLYVTTGYEVGGTIFKLTLPDSITGLTVTGLYNFTNGIDGAQPGGLMEASDGNFYGATYLGGINGTGTLFRLTPAGRFDTIYTFSPANSLGLNPDGISCNGPLVQGPDGNLYGMTSRGGQYGSGTIFRVLLSSIEPVPPLPPEPPQFTNISYGILNVQLTWTTVFGYRYQLQYSPTLDPPQWWNLGASSVAVGSTMMGYDQPAPSSQRYYRVILLP